ncbi:MAG: hypothetical protein WD971_02075 [Pirellulales bacterium]
MNTLLLPLDDDSSTATDTPDAGNAAIELAAHWNGPCCDKCSAPMKSDGVTVCRRCGWYARLNQYVEVDKDWEAYGDDAEQPAPAAAPSHLEVWAKLLPKWAWVIVGTLAAVVVESIFARLVTPADSSLRTTWSLTQLMIGGMAFAGLHVLNFLFAIADDTDTGALDILLRPLKLWIKAFKNLPARLWVTNTTAAGLTAAVMSVVVIGGLPYERLWDWGFKQPPKPNLLGAVASQVQKMEGKGADNLEDAVSDFAGKQNLDDANDHKTPPPPPVVRLEVDCVILGYRVDSNGKLARLILGTAHGGKLIYACAVSPNPDDKESQDLVTALSQIRTNQPYLPTQAEALWVKPMYACRVTCEKQDPKTGRLTGASWKELVGRM